MGMMYIPVSCPSPSSGPPQYPMGGMGSHSPSSPPASSPSSVRLTPVSVLYVMVGFMLGVLSSNLYAVISRVGMDYSKVAHIVEMDYQRQGMDHHHRHGNGPDFQQRGEPQQAAYAAGSAAVRREPPREYDPSAQAIYSLVPTGGGGGGGGVERGGGGVRDEGVALVVGILSAVDNFERRQAVRETWMRYGGGASGVDGGSSGGGGDAAQRWVGVFIVGHPPSRHAAALHAEMREHNDIVIAQVSDTYQSLTMKVLALMAFATDHFPSAYVLKTDDDTFVAADRLLETLAKAPPTCFYNGAQQKLNEQLTWDPNNKWYVPPDEYPFGQNVLYMQGGAYVLSADLARGISEYAASPDFRLPFPSAGFLEDASIGVLLAQQGMQWTCRHSDFRYSGKRPYGNGYCTNDNLLTYHHVDVGTMRKMHVAYAAAAEAADPSASAMASASGNMTLCEVVEAANLEEMDILGDMRVISDASGPLIFADGLRNLVGGDLVGGSADAAGALKTAANQNADAAALASLEVATRGGDTAGEGAGAAAAAPPPSEGTKLDALRQEFAIQAGMRTRVQPGRSKITAFTMVAIETEAQRRRLLEWIDFHMIQGVDRFVIYDNLRDEADAGSLEALLFEYMDVNVVEVIRWPAAWDTEAVRGRRMFTDAKDKEQFEFIVKKCIGGIDKENWFTPDGTEYPRHGDTFPYECQLAMYMDAFAAYRLDSDWLMPFDMDEYMYAPRDATLHHYLRTLPGLITAYQVQCASFGSSGVQEPDESALLIESHTHRAPYVRFGEDEEAVRKAKPGCGELIPGSEWPVCETGPGKTIIRGAAAKPSKANIHDTSPLFGDKIGGGSSIDILCAHYPFPSRAEMEGRRAEHRFAFDHADEFYNAVTDDFLAKALAPAVRLSRQVRTFSDAEQFQGR